MNFCGIICEFNPFHNGHEYLISQVKANLGGDIVCMMSGDFVQRGAPAIECKYERAKKAIAAGADMVCELPCIYACSNAENFAFGAVKTLAALGITHLAFGIEQTNLETLQKIAELKFENSQDFQNSFKDEIENGINYNTALKRAIAKSFIGSDEIFEILNKPNNILAIEYLTAIKKLDAKFEIFAINRVDNGFVSSKNNGKFLSATGIRQKLCSGENVSEFLPTYAKINNPLDKEKQEIFDKILLYKLRTNTPSSLAKLYDYNEGIEFRILEMANKFSKISDIIDNVSTPRYRKPRVAKLLLYCLLNITKDAVLISQKSKPAAKLLAIKKDKKHLLSNVIKSKLDLIVTNADFENLKEQQHVIIDIDKNASDIYNLLFDKPNHLDTKTGAIFT